MHRSYLDITERITEPPTWWDANGAPRYIPFTPKECGVYITAVAYCEVACQSCGTRFMVASEVDLRLDLEEAVTYPQASGTGYFHYGDPPNHGCAGAGDTMNVETLRIVEFWQRGTRGYEWRRAPEYEIDYGEGDLHPPA